MGLIAKRSSMTFLSNPTCHYSHRVRIVLAEKGVTVDIIDVDPDNPPEELAQLNPYNTLPTLVDRELVLFESVVMMEYLDERFPHPPLLPVYPITRAQSRQLVYRIKRDWCRLLDTILDSDTEASQKQSARKELRESLITIAPVFHEKAFFMNDEFTLVDCIIAPILWRLPSLDIELPAQAQPIHDYAERLFARESFKLSLSEPEKEMCAW